MAEFLQWEVWEVWPGGRSKRIAAFFELVEAEMFQRKMIKARPKCEIEIIQGKKVIPRTPKPVKRIYGNGR